MSVRINKIKETTAELYDSECSCIGSIESALQLNDIRIQIMRKELVGYYVMWRGRRLSIDKLGRLDSWPAGFFDTWDSQLDTLLEGKYGDI